jgi:hypothetical protein
LYPHQQIFLTWTGVGDGVKGFFSLMLELCRNLLKFRCVQQVVQFLDEPSLQLPGSVLSLAPALFHFLSPLGRQLVFKPSPVSFSLRQEQAVFGIVISVIFNV